MWLTAVWLLHTVAANPDRRDSRNASAWACVVQVMLALTNVATQAERGAHPLPDVAGEMECTTAMILQSTTRAARMCTCHRKLVDV